MWNRLTGAEAPSEDVSQETSRASMEELEQKELLIQQLKDIVRSNEEILKQKEKELQENNAKFQKFKLQSKARIAQLTNQVKAHEPSPELESGEDMSPSSKPATPQHDAASADVSRGRLRVLKHQLDETKAQFQKKEKEMEASRKSLESMVEQLQSQLAQRDQALMDVEAHRESSASARLSQEGSSSSNQDQERLYAQMVYKDSKILELNNQILELEGRIMDLQENLKEKDEVLHARSRAIQLMTEDLSLRSKTAVDDLDDTRTEMRLMQSNFMEQETQWKERESALQGDLEARSQRLKECEESIRKLEGARFELATRNAELQEKVVRAQEAAERAREDLTRSFQEKLDSLHKDLEAKCASLEEVQKTLRETVSQTDTKVLKARALERRRAKALERELEGLKKGASKDEEVTNLQQHIAELEEEKGALQLKALEMEETLSAQASKLEEMAKKDSAIVELKSKVKAARDDKISLEMRAAELEEQKELEERKMLNMQQELVALKNEQENSVPLLEQELKAALEEEVKKLTVQHEEDMLSLARLTQELEQAMEQMKLATAKADELDGMLQRTLGDLETKTSEAEELNRLREEGLHEIQVRSAEAESLKEELQGALKNLEESKATVEQLNVDAQSRADNARCEIEVLSRKEQELQALLATRTEEMEDSKRALQLALDSLEHKTKEADDARADQARWQSKHKALEASFSEKEREIEQLLVGIGVLTLHELKLAWENVNVTKEVEAQRSHEEIEKFAARVKLLEQALAEEAESSRIRLSEVDTCLRSISVSSLEELVQKWSSLQRDLELLTESQKTGKEEINSQMRLLAEERDELKQAVAARERAVAEATDEIEKLRALVGEKDTALEEQAMQLKTAEEQITDSNAALLAARKSTEAKIATLLEQGGDLEKEVSSLQSQLEEKSNLALKLQGALDSKAAQLEELMRESAAKEALLQDQVANLAKQEQASQEQVRSLQERLQQAASEADLEARSLRESLEAQHEESSRLQSELTSIIDNFEAVKNEKDSAEKQLKELQNELQRTQDTCRELQLSLDAAVKELEDLQAHKRDLEEACSSLSQQLTQASNEKAEVSQQLCEAQQKSEEVAREREALKTKTGKLSKAVKELRRQLSDAQCASHGKENEMSDLLSRLQAEKADLCEKLDAAQESFAIKDRECEKLSARLSIAEQERDKITEMNKSLKESSTMHVGMLNELQEAVSRDSRRTEEKLGILYGRFDKLEESHNSCKCLLAETQTQLEATQGILSKTEGEKECLKQANENAKELNNRLLTEVDALRSREKELELELKHMEQEKDHLSDHINKLASSNAAELESLRNVLQSKDVELTSLRETAESQHADLFSKVSQLSNDLKLKAEELSICNTMLDERSTMVEGLQTEVALLAQKLQASESVTTELAGQVSEFTVKVDEASRLIEVKEEALQKMTEELQASVSNVDRLSGELQHLQDSMNKLSISKQDLQEKYSDAEAEIIKLRETLTEKDSLDSDLEKANEKQCHLTQVLEEQSKIVSEQEARLKVLSEAEVVLKEEVMKLQQENQAMVFTLDELKSKSGAADSDLHKSAEIIGELKSELEKLHHEYQAINLKCEAVNACHALETAEKEKQILELQNQVKSLQQEGTKTKERLELVSAEIENLVATHDQQLKELLDTEAGLRAEIDNYSAVLTEKEGHAKNLEGQLDALRLENTKAREQLAMFSTEIDNIVQNHDQQMKEFSDTNSKLEAEAANYTIRLAETEGHIRDLEVRLQGLSHEKTLVEEKLAHISVELESSTQQHCERMKVSEQQLQKLREEIERLHVFEGLYQETAVQLQDAKDHSRNIEAKLEALEQTSARNQQAASIPMEAVLVQNEASVQNSLKGTLATNEEGAFCGQVEVLVRDLESAQAELQHLQSLLSSKMEHADSLSDELSRTKQMLGDLEAELKLKSEEVLRLQESLHGPKAEVPQEGCPSVGDSEIKKLKLAFKKSRGELRLKVKILEDKTKELEAAKVKNSSLQAELHQAIDALETEKLKGREVSDTIQEYESRLLKADGLVQKLEEDCALARNELAAALEKVDMGRQQIENLQGNLKTAQSSISSLTSQLEGLQQQNQDAAASVERVRTLETELELAKDSVEKLSHEITVLHDARLTETSYLQSVLESTRADLDKMTSEHEDSCRREQVLQEDLEAAASLNQQLHAQHAEFSRGKDEEFEALQAQLESLSSELAQQLELLDSKVDEVNILQSKLQASQHELEKFSAEFCILQDILLQECGDLVTEGTKMQEFSAFECLKQLLGSARSKRKVLEKTLTEKEDQLVSLQQSYKALQDQYQRPLQELSSVVRTIIEGVAGSMHVDMPQEGSELEELGLLVRVLQGQVTLLKDRNDSLAHEAHQLRLSFKDLNERLDQSLSDSLLWQQKYERASHSSRSVESASQQTQRYDTCSASSQTFVEETVIAEKGQLEAFAGKELLATQATLLKEELAALKNEPRSAGADDSTDLLHEDLTATKNMSERTLVKLKQLKEKNDYLETQLNSLRESHLELEQSHREKADEAYRLEERCRMLQEKLLGLPQADQVEASVHQLQLCTARAENAEAESNQLREKVDNLLELNNRLEIEVQHLRSELSSLKEQAEMLVSDNETFQGLAENLKYARQSLEAEIKTQREQHLKAMKDLENEHQRVLDEASKSERALASLKNDYSHVQEKYNNIIYRHRDLEEEFHVIVEEKQRLEAKCVQLAEDCAAAKQAAALIEKQSGISHKTLQEFESLRQDHQQLQERFHHLKSAQLKEKERLVQTQSTEATDLKARLQEAEAKLEQARSSEQSKAAEAMAQLQRQLEELSQQNASLKEQSQAKEGKWNQEKKQLKHIEEHLKEAAQNLSDELQMLKAQHQDLSTQTEQVQRDNKSLTQQVQNWKSYIRDFESGQDTGGQSAEVDKLRLELDHTMKDLHQLGLRNEEMTVDLSKVLEEKNSLKQQLSHYQEALRQREAQLIRLQSTLPSTEGSYVINVEDTSQQGALANLEKRLRESEQVRQELQEAVEDLTDRLRTEKQRRTLIEGELDDMERDRMSPLRTASSESRQLLLSEDIIKIPATDYSITRQVRSHASKFRRWLQGKQEVPVRAVLHV